MATTTRTRAPNSTKRKATAPRSRSTASRANSTSKASANEIVGGYAGGFLQAVRARPYAAAAIAAGAAGASAFLWAKRAMIGEQASAAGEKLVELRGQASDQASALKGKVSERFFASDDSSDMDPASAAKTERMSSRRSKRSQSEIAAEALSLKQVGDPMAAEQSKIGAVAY
jgi:hypothetical protein